VKTPLFLLFLAIVSCVHQERKYYSADGTEIRDCLSDIAVEVVAVPLESNEYCRLGELRQVKCDGQDVFIRSGNGIYHFDRTGKFKNRFAVEAGRHICDYVPDPLRKQVMILDSVQYLSCHAYDGQALFLMDPGRPALWQTILHIACYGDSLWIAAERLTADSRFEKRFFRMDFDGRIPEDYGLAEAGQGRFSLSGHLSPELAVAGDGRLYVYSPSSLKETILQDTLHLLSGEALPPAVPTGALCVMPVRVDSRFLFASRQKNESEKENYMFLYDRKKNKTYSVQGFVDDFYRTGPIKDLQALDVHSHAYCYYRSGKDVAASFPERSESDNPVLFLLRLAV
jgi:hypothetical protein